MVAACLCNPSTKLTHRYVLFWSLLVPCTLMYHSNNSFVPVPKNQIARLRFINQFMNSLWYKKIVLQYIRRVVLVSFSKKKYQRLRQTVCPHCPISTQKMAVRSSQVVRAAAAAAAAALAGGGGSGVTLLGSRRGWAGPLTCWRQPTTTIAARSPAEALAGGGSGAGSGR